MKLDRVSQLQQNLTNIARAVSHVQPAERTAALAGGRSPDRLALLSNQERERLSSRATEWGKGARGFPAQRRATANARPLRPPQPAEPSAGWSSRCASAGFPFHSCRSPWNRPLLAQRASW